MHLAAAARARTNPKAKQRRTHRGQYAVWCTNQSLPRTAGRRHPSGSAPRKVLRVGLHRGRRLLHATDALCQRRARLIPAARAPKDARQLSGDCGLIRLDRPRQLLAHRNQLDTVATGCQKGTVATGHLQRAGSLGRGPPQTPRRRGRNRRSNPRARRRCPNTTPDLPQPPSCKGPSAFDEGHRGNCGLGGEAVRPETTFSSREMGRRG